MPSKQLKNRELLPPFGALPPARPGGVAQRNKRLLTALWISLPFIVVMILVGASLIGLSIWTWTSQRAAGAEDFDRARAGYARQAQVTNGWFLPWVSQYNLGTVAAQQQDWEQGVQWLETALETVPQAVRSEDGTIQPFSYECQVRINLATSMEGIGDAQRAAEDLPAAETTYTDAIAIVAACQLTSAPDDGESEGEPTPQDPGEDQGTQTTERLENKRDQVQKEQNGEDPDEPGDNDPGQPNGPGSGDETKPTEEDPFSGETPAEKERREQLEQRNNDQKERERDTPYQRDPGSRGW